MRRVPWLTVLAIVVLGGAAIAETKPFVWDGPLPPVTSISDLASPVFDKNLGLTLDPPGNAKPGVSGEEAIDRAWEEEGAPGGPKSVHASFALLTWGVDYKSKPVWVLTYEGGQCMPAAGPPDADPDVRSKAFTR